MFYSTFTVLLATPYLISVPEVLKRYPLCAFPTTTIVLLRNDKLQKVFLFIVYSLQITKQSYFIYHCIFVPSTS